MGKQRVDRGIYKIGDGVFEVAVSTGRQPDGRYGQVFRRYHGTLTSARAFRRTLLSEVADGQHVGGGLTVDALFDAWLADLERLGRAPKTINSYRDDARTYWRPPIGAKRVTKIERSDIRTVLNGLTARGLAPSTLDHVHACISSAFSWAVSEDWIGRDVTKNIPLPPRVVTRPIVPTPADVVALLRAAATSPRPEMERFTWLGAIVGARSSELRALRLSAIDLDAGRLVIDRALSAEVEWSTKNRRVRTVNLDPLTVRVVADQLAFLNDRAKAVGAALDADSHLFTDDIHGRTPWREDMVTRYFSTLADNTHRTDGAGSLGRFTFKHLRKFMDTHGQELGFSIDDVADRAGHTVTIARRHYTGERATTDRRLSAALAAVLDDLQHAAPVRPKRDTDEVELAAGITIERDTLDAFCRAHGIRTLHLYGSALRDQLRPDSDIDLLVEFEPDRTPGLLRIAQLELELTDLLGRDVDLRTPADLSEYFRDEVASHARLLYDAA